jgi:hypothetical protein
MSWHNAAIAAVAPRHGHLLAQARIAATSSYVGGWADGAGPTQQGARRRRGGALEFILYGLDEAGDPAFAERLPLEVRPQLKDIARERLDRCHMVEVWQGPACVLRLRRDGAVHA